jgi:CRISPR system Cascade subunit CasD
MKFLIFTLYGPMASWGNTVVGDSRTTWSAPSKSAVIGLLEAALGIKRTDEHIDPSDYGLAVMVRSSGSLLTDFHVTQMARTIRIKKETRIYPTRRSEIESFKQDRLANPVVSNRDYWCDAFYIIGLWIKTDNPKYSLGDIKQALNYPTFHLYLGRKSYPPSLPLGPTIIDSKTLRDAFESTDLKFDKMQNIEGNQLFKKILSGGSVRIYWDELENSGYMPNQTFSLRDIPVNRKSWTFRERDVNYISYDLPKENQDVS